MAARMAAASRNLESELTGRLDQGGVATHAHTHRHTQQIKWLCSYYLMSVSGQNDIQVQ